MAKTTQYQTSYVPTPDYPGENIFQASRRRRAERKAFEEYQKQQDFLRQEYLYDKVTPEAPAVPFVDEQAQFMGQESPRGLVAQEATPETRSMNPFLKSMRDSGVPEPVVQFLQNNPQATKEDIQSALGGINKSQSDTPMSVKEWEYYNSLSEENKPKYLEMKRQAYAFGDVAGVPTMVPKVRGLPVIPVSNLEKEATGKATLAEATESGKTLGEGKTKAGLELPGAEADALESTRLVDELIAHPGLRYAIGPAGFIPAVPGTSQADFISRLEQLQGRQFMDARQLLKGGGQITDFEGKKAEQGIARMQRAQSVSEFVKGAKEYKDAVTMGVAKLRRKAGPKGNQEPLKPSGGTLSDEQREALKKRHGL